MTSSLFLLLIAVSIFKVLSKKKEQKKKGVALVKGLNLTFHNIELNTIMQNVSFYISDTKVSEDLTELPAIRQKRYKPR